MVMVIVIVVVLDKVVVVAVVLVVVVVVVVVLVIVQSVTNIFEYSNIFYPNIYSGIRLYHFLYTNIFGYSLVSNLLRMSHSALVQNVPFIVLHFANTI